MTTRFDYTTEEWNLILQAPAFAGIFIIQADAYSPPMARLKMLAALTAIVEAAEQNVDIELIKAVTDAVRVGHFPHDPVILPRNLSQARQIVLDGCRQVASLLAQKAPANEAEAYKRWLINIAERVACLPAEPWVLGLSEQESDGNAHAALEKLVAALDAI